MQSLHKGPDSIFWSSLSGGHYCRKPLQPHTSWQLRGPLSSRGPICLIPWLGSQPFTPANWLGECLNTFVLEQRCTPSLPINVFKVKITHQNYILCVLYYYGATDFIQNLVFIYFRMVTRPYCPCSFVSWGYIDQQHLCFDLWSFSWIGMFVHHNLHPPHWPPACRCHGCRIQHFYPSWKNSNLVTFRSEFCVWCWILQPCLSDHWNIWVIFSDLVTEQMVFIIITIIIFISGFQNTLKNVQMIPYLKTLYVQFRDEERKEKQM